MVAERLEMLSVVYTECGSQDINTSSISEDNRLTQEINNETSSSLVKNIVGQSLKVVCNIKAWNLVFRKTA